MMKLVFCMGGVDMGSGVNCVVLNGCVICDM